MFLSEHSIDTNHIIRTFINTISICLERFIHTISICLECFINKDYVFLSAKQGA